MEDDILEMLLFFWNMGNLYFGFNIGVLKLVPKKSDRRKIQN